MRRFLTTAATVAFSLSVAAPAFAYIGVGHDGRISRRDIVKSAEGAVTLPMFRAGNQMRGESAVDSTGRSILQRGVMRRVRRLNRQPKAGFDRYRILNIEQSGVERNDPEAALPPTIVQTGNSNEFPRVTRRTVMQWGERDILAEIARGSTF